MKLSFKKPSSGNDIISFSFSDINVNLSPLASKAQCYANNWISFLPAFATSPHMFTSLSAQKQPKFLKTIKDSIQVCF